MSKKCELNDDEFVPFLHSLGVETFKKSFEWLTDSTYSRLFSWLFNNLDLNNALTPREEYRYAELLNLNKLLSSEDLESTLLSIQQDFPGICLPGDNEGLEDAKLDNIIQRERLHALEKREQNLRELIKQNELIKDQLAIEITKLNAAEHQCTEDDAAAATECLALAEEVETLNEGVMDVIADALDIYAKCHVDKDIAKRFLAFGPLEPYRQSQALFRSHFDLYTSRNFTKKLNDSFSDEDLRSALVEAKKLEERLSDAALAYIESKADLCGEQAKLELVTNYTNVHPSQIDSMCLEAQSAVELLAQEEAILDHQIQTAVRDLATSRTQLAAHTAAQAALAVREQVLASLSHLSSVCVRALSMDAALYCAVRHSLRSLQDAAHAAAHSAQRAQRAAAHGARRVESMNEIIAAQEAAESNLKNSDLLRHTLSSILGCQVSDDVRTYILQYQLLNKQLKEAREDLKEDCNRREEEVKQFKRAQRPLQSLVFSGAGRGPRGEAKGVAVSAHALRARLAAAEGTVHALGASFTQVKGGDKDNMRKVWQWFLTDPGKLSSLIKSS